MQPCSASTRPFTVFHLHHPGRKQPRGGSFTTAEVKPHKRWVAELGVMPEGGGGPVIIETNNGWFAVQT